MIVDDARLSRLICHVAERFDMSCLAIRKTDDISAAVKKSRPDVILLDPEPCETQGRNVLRKLAEQHTDAAIVLTSVSLDQTGQLEDLGDSFGLNMAGVLPDVFDVDILKQEFILIFQRVGKQLTGHPVSGTDKVMSVPDNSSNSNSLNDSRDLKGG